MGKFLFIRIFLLKKIDESKLDDCFFVFILFLNIDYQNYTPIKLNIFLMIIIIDLIFNKGKIF